MIDSYKHQGLRRQLVDSLKEKGINDEGVLNAINKIPRHFFMDNAFLEFAYQDKAFPIAESQTISQPFTVAFQTQLLEVKPGEKVLEIGTGSGYQTSVLCELGARVWTIERIKTLFDGAKKMFTKLHYKPKQFFGDGFEGLPKFAPFDKILVTAGAPHVPPNLLEQLEIGGMMVIPVGKSAVQTMKVIVRVSDTEYKEKKAGSFQFVPLLEAKKW
ncbi:MAG: protein-L-isoaspartate(D-aspartate) O-methyltransferase [Bacteroidia bacterium]|nr:protein-L-isoaspartate(D-aspartate) O-methyltransferase [Bacteroidia bacterium]NNM16529.1 protein-L-isoaspartate(D-aspartate) O-methyltransferase [Bacteroidia bacterium]